MVKAEELSAETYLDPFYLSACQPFFTLQMNVSTLPYQLIPPMGLGHILANDEHSAVCEPERVNHAPECICLELAESKRLGCFYIRRDSESSSLGDGDNAQR
jgi:hypothetical protein